MGNQCSAFKKGKGKRKQNENIEIKNDEDYRKEKIGIDSPVMLLFLPEKVRDKEETMGEETIHSQAVQNLSEPRVSTEKRISLTNEHATVEVPLPR